MDKPVRNNIPKFLGLVVALVTSALLGGPLTQPADAEGLPKTMTWTAYDVGSAGYAEASAIADAMGKDYGTKVRIMPSGSSIGRLLPMTKERALYGYLGNEAYFASEGIYDFATMQWGPQDLRTLLGRPSSFGIPTAKDAGIRKLADLRGKRVAFVAGNPSVNVKGDALLAFAGLTRDDVQAIMFPTYKAAMESMVKNEADAVFTTTTPSQLYELESSPRGIYWIPIPADDKAGWDKLDKVVPFFKPYKETAGAGIPAGSSIDVVAYRYPVLTTYASTSADEVYEMVKAIDKTYPQYKSATAVMPRWDIKLSGTPPVDTPFHDGAIRYLKEIGVWTGEFQAWNDRLLKRQAKLQAAWKVALGEAKQQNVAEADFEAFWLKARAKALAQ